MAAFIKAVNAKIRSNPTVSYFCSTRKNSSSLALRTLNPDLGIIESSLNSP